MISSKEALEIVLRHPFVPSAETISFKDCNGRVLEEDLFVQFPIPPFDRVSMDGIAVQSDDPALSGGALICIGMQQAGVAPMNLPGPGYCVEVMTGAICPSGADSVVPYEHLEKTSDGFKLIQTFNFKGQNIHRKGSDKKEGDILIRKSTVLGAPESGALASTGNISIQVKALPKVVLFSTGNELVDPGAQPLNYQVRRSNVFMIEALLASSGIEVTHLHLDDDLDKIRSAVTVALETYDVLLFSGAVSKGKFDFLPKVLDELGVQKCFHGVRQKPGKPFWFGTKGDRHIFAFPGNPVSTLVCATIYFKPWWNKSLGIKTHLPRAQVINLPEAHKELTLFVQVKIQEWKEGIAQVIPVAGHGSGDYTSLLEADGFIELLPVDDPTPAAFYPLHLFRKVL